MVAWFGAPFISAVAMVGVLPSRCLALVIRFSAFLCASPMALLMASSLAGFLVRVLSIRCLASVRAIFMGVTMVSGFCASVMVVMISLKTLNPSVLLGGGPVELVMQFLFVSVAFFSFGVVPRFLWDRSKYGVGLVFGIGSARLSELGLALVGSFP